MEDTNEEPNDLLDVILSDTSDETDIMDSHAMYLPDNNIIYLPEAQNDFQVILNNSTDDELLHLKIQFESKADQILFTNSILSEELTRLHNKFVSQVDTYKKNNEIDIIRKRKIYNYKVLKTHYIDRMAFTEHKYQEVMRLILKIKEKIERLDHLKKFEVSTHEALCLICCDSETVISLDCKHELCMKCTRRIEICPYCRRVIL